MHLVEFAGNYDRGLQAPRAAIAADVIGASGEDVDFIVVFTEFEFATGEALAFYNPVRNDVLGTGQPLYDFSPQFGSAGRLQGYVDMAALGRYSFNSRDPAYQVPLNVLSHELMHRWGVRVRYRTVQGEASNALLGRDGAHWSLLADTDASVMYGGRWQPQAEGGFRLVEAQQRFSLWDLYLAGLAAPAEVPTKRLLRGSSLDPTALPSVGLQTEASVEEVSIEQVVAVEGVRTPSHLDAQRHFTAALVLLVRPEQSVEDAKLAQLQRFADRYESYFQSITEGRASLRFVNGAAASARPGAPVPRTGSSPLRHTDPVAAGVAWLRQQQQTGGGFSDFAGSAVRDTVIALRAIQQVQPDWAGAAAAREFLVTSAAANEDDRVRLAAVGGLGDETGAASGLVSGWRISPFDLALSASLYADGDPPDSPPREELLAALIHEQSADGGFASVSGGALRLRSTLMAARALLAFWPEGSVMGDRVRNWLLAQLLDLPLQGAQAAGTSELADALLLAGELQLPESLRLRLRSALEARQGAAGDWEGSVYTTAAASLALARLNQPDLEVVAVAVVPEAPLSGEPVRLRTRVRNAGGVATPEVSYAWHRESPPGSGSHIDVVTARVPALIPGESAWLEVQVETQGWPESVHLRVHLDAADELIEVSEANNFADLGLQFASPGAQVDLALIQGEQAFSPARFQRIGDTVTLSGQVRNLGGTSVQQALLRMDHLQSGTRSTMAQTRLDIEAGSHATYSLDFLVSSAGDHQIELLIDPERETDDFRRDNNSLRLLLSAEPGVDLALQPETLVLQPQLARLGRDQRIRVESRNLGSTASGLAEAALFVLQNDGPQVLQRLPLQLDGGASTSTEFVWRPTESGVIRLRIQLDPDGLIDEIDRGNNSHDFDVQVSAAQGVDLLVLPGTTRATPASPLQGRPLRIDASIANQGEQLADGYQLGLFLGDPRSGGVRLVGVPGPALSAGESAEVSLTVDSFPARGDVSLFLMADSELDIDEADENNNFGIVDAIALALPDASLSAEQVLLEPQTPLPSLPVSLRARVSNLGEQRTGPVQALLFGLRQGDAHPISSPIQVPGLEPGEIFWLHWQWTGDTSLPDALLVRLDPEHESPDGDRSNNELSIPLLANLGEAFALVPYFSPNDDGVRDRAAAVFPGPAAAVHRVEVRDVHNRLIAQIESSEPLPGERSLVWWDGLDHRGRLAPDGSYVMVAFAEDQRVLGRVRVVLDTDRPMALASVAADDAVTRRLPASVNEWLVAPTGSAAEDYLFTWGDPANSLQPLRRGIARTHALFGGVEPVVSSNWLERNANSSAITSLMIEPGLGRELVFTVNGGVWIQEVDALDQARLIGSLPTSARDARIVGFVGEKGVVLQQSEAWSHLLIAVDLQSGESRVLSDWGPSFFVQSSPHGVLLGQQSWQVLGEVLPTDFVPADPSRPAVSLDLIRGSNVDCFARFETAGEHPALYWHLLDSYGERVEWIDLASGERSVLLEKGPGGCPVSSGSSFNPKLTRMSPRPGFAQARAVWIEARQAAVVVDHALRVVREVLPTGVVSSVLPFDSEAPSGDYVERAGWQPPRGVARGEAVGDSAACPVRLVPDLSSAVGREARGRAEFDPWTEDLYFVSGEVVLDRRPPDQGGASSGGYGYTCAGATEYLALSLESGELRRIAARTGWALREASDRERFPTAAGSVSEVRLPPEWPRFIQHAGVWTRIDARIAAGGSGLGRPWASAARLLRSIHEESRLLLNDAANPRRAVSVVSALDRLRSELRASSNGRSVSLFGYATDANLDYFQIDYARVDSPEQWLSILPARRESVRGDEFLTWAPPQSGAYLFRLRVVDRAGNLRDSFASAELVFSSPIGNVRTDHRAISPNGDGVKDSLQLDFVVSRPAELGIRVVNEAGDIVRRVDLSFGASELGAQQWTWDGRDDQGRVVPDGLYRIELSVGFAFPVFVDTVFPSFSSGSLTPAYPPPDLPMAQLGQVRDLRGVVDVSSELELYLEFRPAGQAEWARHPAAYDPLLGGAPLQWLELFAGQFRWVAEDRAGNRSVLEMPGVAPALVLVGAESRTYPHGSSWQAAPFSAARMRDLPEHRSGPNEPATAVLPGEGRSVYFLADYEQPRPVALDLARTAGALSALDAPLNWQALPEVLPTALGGGLFRVDADLGLLERAEIIGLRVRERSGGVDVRVSNAMRFNSPDPRLTCDPSSRGWEFSILLPASAIRAKLTLTSSTGTAVEVEGQRLVGRLDRRERWYFPVNGEQRDWEPRVHLWFSGGAQAFEFTSAQVDRAACRDGSPGGGAPGPARARLTISPQSSGVCNEQVAPQGVRALPELPTGSRSFRLELLDPRFSEPVVVAASSGDRPNPDGYAVSTDGLPGLEGSLRLVVVEQSGNTIEHEQQFPIPWRALEATIAAPASGVRVCSIAGAGEGVDVFLNTDNASLWGLEVASLAGPEPRYEWLSCNGQPDHRACQALDERPLSSFARPSQRSFSQRVLALPNARVPDGPVSFRLRALDWNGVQVCSTTTVQIDAGVQLEERRAATPEAIDARPPAISHSGSEEFSAVRWYFRAREPLQLRAELHAAVAVGPPAQHRYVISGPPLAQLSEGAQPIGEFDIDWNARLEGQPAPDGVYALRLHAVDDCGHEREIIRFVRVDSTPPEVEIVAPADQAELRLASVQLVGSVRDDHPDSYDVSFSVQGPDGPWQQIAEGRGNVAQPRALGTLQTHGLLGPIWLRLGATDSLGNSAQRVHRVTLLTRPDVLASARLSHALVSPNGDGRLDSLDLRLVLLREARLDVDLLSAGGQVLGRLAEARLVGAGPFNLSWGDQHDPQTMPDGLYGLRVRATDAELGGEPDEALLDFLIDTQAPALTWAPALPAVLSCDESPQLSVEDPLLAEFRAELRTLSGTQLRELSGASEGVFSFAGFELLPEGEYRIHSVALDQAGNRSELEAGFVLDCTPPALQLLEPRAEQVLARAEGVEHALQGRAEDAHLHSYRIELVSYLDPGLRQVLLDSNDPAQNDFGLRWSAELADGAYQLRFSAIDLAGNFAELELPLEIDGTPPHAEFHAPDPGAELTGELGLVVTVNDANLESWQVLTATPPEAARDAWTVLMSGDQVLESAPLPVVQGLPSGQRLFRLVAIDRAGLRAQAELQVLIDAEPPPAPIDLVASVESGGNVRLAWRGGDADDLAGFHVYRIGAGMPVRINPDLLPHRQYLDLEVPDGAWFYQVTAVDRVGNESDPSNRAQVRVDRTPPQVRIVQPANGERVRGLVAVRGTAAGEGDFQRYELALLDASGQQLSVLRESTAEVRSGVLGQWDTRQAAEGSGLQLRLRAWDRSGNRAEAVVAVEVDNLPPAAPQGLDGQLQGADLELSWLPNQEPDLLGYLLYRNGRLLSGGSSLPADLRPLALSHNGYLDPAVPDGEHVYRVYAIDLAGNISPPSLPFSPIVEQGPPSAEILRPDDGELFDQPLEVLAQTEHLDVAEIAFFVRAAGQSQWLPLGEPVRSPPWRQVLGTDDRPYGEYELRAVATDHGGLSDPQPPSVRVLHQDITPPPVPAALAARAQGDRILLSWSESEAADLSVYALERFEPESGWVEVQQIAAGSQSAIDADRGLGRHRYRVRAVDASGNSSEPSPDAEAEVFAIDLDRLPFSPSAAPEVALSGRSPRAGEVLIQRELNGASEALPGATVAADLRFELDAALSEGRNLLRISVADSSGNESLAFALAQTHQQPPSAPEGLQGSVAANQVSLQWQPTASAVGYRVYRNGSPIQPDLPLAQAMDARSAGVPVPAVLDGDPGSSWDEQPGSLSDRLSQRLELIWPVSALVGGLELEWRDSASSARDFDVFGWYDDRWNLLAEVRNQAGASYRLQLQSAYPTERMLLVPRRAQWPGARHALSGLRVLTRALQPENAATESIADGRHTYTVTAVSALGFESPVSTQWIAEVGDSEPPPPVVLSGVLDGRDALLSWTASEAADLRRYRLLHNGRVLAELSADTREYLDLNLPNGVHRYQVLAEDLVGNLSVPSNEVQFSIEGEGPGVPVLLQALSQADQPALELHWRPGAGASPQRYRLHVSFSADDPSDPYREIARHEASPWLHQGLAYGQRLYYRIQAEDSAGNLSEMSPPFQAQVRDLRTPSAPLITWPGLAPQRMAWQQPDYRVCGLADPGQRVELRVNGQARADIPTHPDSRVQPSIELGGSYASGHAISPDGSRIAWLDDQGRARERSLDSGLVREVPVPLCCELTYSSDGGALGGIDVLSGDWVWWSESGGERRLTLLEYTAEAHELPNARGWLVLGSHQAEFGLWWLPAPGATPIRIGLDPNEYLRSVAMGSDPEVVYLLSHSGRVYRWVIGQPDLQEVALDGVAMQLRTTVTGEVWVLEDLDVERRVLRVDLPEAQLLLQAPLSTQSVVAAVDGQDLWVLADGALRRYGRGGTTPLETLPIDSELRATQLLPTRAGRMLLAAPYDGSRVQIADEAGSWCTHVIAASSGLTEILALARNVANVWGPASALLELDVDALVQRYADLAVGSADIRLLPSPGIAGQPHSVTVQVRNLGLRPALDFDIQIEVTDPAGQVRLHTRRTSLQPQQQSVQSIALGALVPGDYRVRVVLDSEGRIPETSTLNNAAEASFRVRAEAEPVLDLSVHSAQQAPGHAFEGMVTVSVAQGFSGRLELWVADSAGELVQRLSELSTGSITPHAPWSRPWRWQPQPGLLAGGYRLHARLLDPSGSVRAEQSLDLVLQLHMALALSLQPASTRLQIGQPLEISLGIDVPSANAIVDGGQLRLSAVSADGSSRLIWSGATGTLSAGYRLRRTLLWPTAGESEGDLQLRLEFNAPQLERSLTRVVSLSSAEGAPALFGELALQPSASVALGQPAQLSYRVGNRGGLPITGQALRVRLLGEAGEVLPPENSVVNLAAGEIQSFQLDLVDLPQRPSQYTAVLEAEQASVWRTLAQLGLQSVDVEPPLGTLLSPPSERPVRTPTQIEASIRDRHSRVDYAEYSLNGGAWRGLPGAGERFTGMLGALPDGEHHIAVRAQDIWGNRWQLPPQRFVVDNTPPVIDIQGVVDGQHYPAPVAPTFSAQDPHLETVQAWVNGDLFSSGTPLDEEGPQRLEVQAVDAAGNRAQRVLNFVLDFTPPEISFIAPGADTQVSAPHILVELQTEPDALVELTAAAWQTTVRADGEGRVLLPAVPLQPGLTVLQAEAVDRAGNRSARVSREVTRIEQGGELVGQIGLDSATHPRSEPLSALLALHNQTANAVQGTALLRLQSASGQSLAELSREIELAVEQRIDWSELLPTAAWPLGAIAVELRFLEGGTWISLASATLDLVDRQPPQIVLLQPGDGALVSSPINLRVQAIDDDALAAVSYRLNEGAWTSLAGAGELHEATLMLADGNHRIIARAVDRSGNESLSPTHNFVVDSSPPEIVVEGVADEGLYGEPVRVLVRMVDAHPDTLALSLNGAPFESGSLVDQSGRYRLHALAVDQLGQSSERQIDFELDLEPVSLELWVPEEGSILSSDRVDLIGQTKPGALVSAEGPLSTHQVAADPSGAFRVDAVALQPGANLLTLRAVDALGRPSPELRRSVQFDGSGQQGLSGVIDIGKEIPVDQAWSLRAELRESLGVSRAGLEARIVVERSGQEPALVSWVTDLPGGVTQQHELAGPIQSTLGLVQLRLQVRLEGAWVDLAQRSLAVVDRTPPELTLLSPSEDSYHGGAIELRAQASDQHGEVVSVLGRITGGDWIKLQPLAGDAGHWGGQLSPQFEGELQIELRAQDQALNWSSTTQRRVIHDRTPPQIQVSGVSEGGLYRERVHIQVSATDASPVQLVVELNGQPFVNGQWVEAHGVHAIGMRATDAAGNTSTLKLGFEIDLIPPELAIVSPQPGDVIRSEETPVLGHTEPGARIELRVFDLQRELLADAQGQFRFDRVPLRIGANRIDARAIDAAGNVGSWVAVEVERRGGFALRGALQAPTELEVGRSLPVRVQVWNDALHPQPGVALRLLVRDALGQERLLDARSHGFAAGEALDFSLDVSTSQWPAGMTTLRLMAADTVELQLAELRVNLRAVASQPPPLARPQIIPAGHPLALSLLVLALLAAGWLSLRRAGAGGRP